MRSLLSLLAISVVAVGCQRAANQAAVDLAVKYDFKAGCLTVTSVDTADRTKTVSAQVAAAALPPASNATPNTVHFAVFRNDDWGHEVEITTELREASCQGAVVGKSVSTVVMPEKGTNTVAVDLKVSDADDDGYVARSATSPGTDCDDADSTRAPNVAEVCDLKDNDCNDLPDDGLSSQTYYRDQDGDGVGTSASAKTACAAPTGYVLSSAGNDCDDAASTNFPGNTEVCDGFDNNCVNGVDEGFDKTWYRDNDQDGHGDKNLSASNPLPTKSCTKPTGSAASYVQNHDDCDDAKATNFPGNSEVCDGSDNNCDTVVDEGYNKTWYTDADGDTYGTGTASTGLCTAPAGKPAYRNGDCNDADAAINPGATEKCNLKDDNCNTTVDETFNTGACSRGVCTGTYQCSTDGLSSSCNATVPGSLGYVDFDGDGEGKDPICTVGQTGVANADDCDDGDKYNRASGAEVCDQRDNNCSGSSTDESAVCPAGAAWAESTTSTGSPATPITFRALSIGGSTTWFAGDAGGLVLVSGGTTSDKSSDCAGAIDFKSVWTRPSDGTAFLGGVNGALRAHNKTACSTPAGSGSTSNITGIIGFEDGGVTKLFLADSSAQLWKYEAGAYLKFFNLGGTVFNAVGGPNSSTIYAAGDAGNKPVIYRAKNTTTAAAPDAMVLAGVPGGYSGTLRSIQVPTTTYGVAVGDGGLVLLTGDGSTWTVVPGPGSMGLTSVAANDPYSTYVTDVNGTVWRMTVTPTGTGFTIGWVVHTSVTSPLRAIGLTAPTNIWAAGDAGVRLHWHEP